MSTARSCLAATGVVLAVGALGAAGCGGGGKGTKTQTFADNGRNFRGPTHPVAAIVDQLAVAARAGQTGTICKDLFTPALARKVAAGASDKTCDSGVRANLVSRSENITAELITVKPATARVVVREQNGKESVLLFVKQSGAWRINSIGPLKT